MTINVNNDNMNHALRQSMNDLFGLTPSQRNAYERAFRRGYRAAYTDAANNVRKTSFNTASVAGVAFRDGYQAGMTVASNLGMQAVSIDGRNAFIRAGGADARFTVGQYSAYSRLGLI